MCVKLCLKHIFPYFPNLACTTLTIPNISCTRWPEEFQENLYRENLAMLDKIDGLAGTTPWILKDFRSPRRVLTGIQNYYNMKGLVSDEGERKKAWYVLKKWYEGK